MRAGEHWSEVFVMSTAVSPCASSMLHILCSAIPFFKQKAQLVNAAGAPCRQTSTS